MRSAAEGLLREANKRAEKVALALGGRDIDGLLRIAQRVFKTILLFIDGRAGIV